MTTALRSTLVVPRYWPARGGSEMHSRHLAQCLSDAGMGINVVCHSSTDDLPTEVALASKTGFSKSDGDYQIHQACPTGARRQALNLLAAQHAKNRFVRPVFDRLLRPFSTQAIHHCAADAQLIHSIYNGLTCMAEAALAAARRRKIPFIWSPLANTDLPEGQGWSSRRFRNLYRQADAIIALTRHEKSWLEQQGADPQRTFVCPMGPMVTQPTPRQTFLEAHRLTEGPTVLFLGRHDEPKGYLRLLQAASTIWRERPDAQLLFIGPQTDASRRHFQRYSDPRITVLEDISQADKNAALAACDLLCVPSTAESLGVVYLEAWHYKKPVVALDIPVLHSVISHEIDGLLCPADASELGGSVARLLNDSELRQSMGESGLEKLQRDFSWSAITRQHMNIYAYAIANPRG
ncbi:glycosyltransferase family 4 protein [Marinobacter salinisoli]|uniref:Glycosyltransferase family 4 protein n=1 Tax=Marinobacter salinisoli TaxID=2769486 RepID=A0ABX7MUP4_9GAMM|nr:glycosyltransferase family 4 protein [Marinobacter salinisoli]QSP93978.1 glycosyltransferase family 4 protein [Marinobacter salinisoli]